MVKTRMKASTPPEAAAFSRAVWRVWAGSRLLFGNFAFCSCASSVRQLPLSVVVGRAKVHLGIWYRPNTTHLTTHQSRDRPDWITAHTPATPPLLILSAPEHRCLFNITLRPTATQRKKRTKGSSAATLPSGKWGGQFSAGCTTPTHRLTVVHCCSCCHHRPVGGAGRCLHHQ